jgi:ATP-dependent DNA helicase RecQ
MDEAVLQSALQRWWGFDGFLPGQREAIESVVRGHDSLVVFPTGGGKSLTYQLPALVLPGTAVVVSPLIALMKDQVDQLVANGIPAATLNSSLEGNQSWQVRQGLREGRIKLLYISPERLLTEDMIDLLTSLHVSFFAIDEAHCISHWGHDFRPGYRALGQLRTHFEGLPVHACTATATEAVRADIIRQLGLRSPQVLVGSFDRPNLRYRAFSRQSLTRQIEELLERHRGEAGVIYCIRRADVDDLCARLVQRGVRAVPYHAGLSAEQRHTNQEAFKNEQADVVVATVAFGMGIDRSNVRFVAHTGMPKSIEHYQQEAGRAGRDGLPAECILFYSSQDLLTWRTILGEPVTEADHTSHRKLEEMFGFCRSLVCRHRFLVEYFGQGFDRERCDACDHCLGEHRALEDSQTMARKILSCVARVKQRFGAQHVAEVLRGGSGAKIIQLGHHELSTYGLLKQYGQAEVLDWIDQLVAGGFLQREPEHRTLLITPAGKKLLIDGEGDVALTTPRPARGKGKRRDEQPIDDADGAVDRELFESLRQLRRRLAQEKAVPPYVIFDDKTMRELSRHKPLTEPQLLRVRGIGETKARTLGPFIIEAIRVHLGLEN